jgi:hypothetical protein
MAFEVPRRVLARAVVHVLELADDLGTRRARVCAVGVGVLDRDVDRLGAERQSEVAAGP